MEAVEQSCVLVVDDDEAVRETVCEALEMIGCTAITAENGVDALKVLETHRPCLIVLDLLMPVMTGQEMLEAMRKEPKLADLPVLISTSAPHIAPAGVPVLAKPIDLDAFWRWVRAHCACPEPATP
jgi:two-component system, chemotaxis family, chemotaxis protein CheY